MTKQVQHLRKYRSGKVRAVNSGVTKRKYTIFPEEHKYIRVLDAENDVCAVTPNMPFMAISKVKQYIRERYMNMLKERNHPVVFIEVCREWGKIRKDTWNADILRANLREDELKKVKLKEWDYNDFEVVKRVKFKVF